MKKKKIRSWFIQANKQLHEEKEDTFMVYTSEQDTERLYEPWIIPVY